VTVLVEPLSSHFHSPMIETAEGWLGLRAMVPDKRESNRAVVRKTV